MHDTALRSKRRSRPSALSTTSLRMYRCHRKMRSLAHFLLIISLVVWVGSIVFFSFVVAPAVFSVLPAQEIAGAIVGRSLGALHRIGLTCGVIFLAATLLGTFRHSRMLRGLVGLILLCTAFSKFCIT